MRNMIHIGLRTILGAIFIWASWDKILSPRDFAQIISNYQLVPDALVPAAAVLLPWTEAVCGLCLITGIGTGGAALIVNTLLMVFIGALSLNLYRGLDVNCGCFSVQASAPGSTPLEIARDAAILAVGLVVLIGDIRGRNPLRRAHNGERKPV